MRTIVDTDEVCESATPEAAKELEGRLFRPRQIQRACRVSAAELLSSGYFHNDLAPDPRKKTKGSAEGGELHRPSSKHRSFFYIFFKNFFLTKKKIVFFYLCLFILKTEKSFIFLNLIFYFFFVFFFFFFFFNFVRLHRHVRTSTRMLEDAYGAPQRPADCRAHRRDSTCQIRHAAHSLERFFI
jgi:hypothetical protein